MGEFGICLNMITLPPGKDDCKEVSCLKHDTKLDVASHMFYLIKLKLKRL